MCETVQIIRYKVVEVWHTKSAFNIQELFFEKKNADQFCFPYLLFFMSKFK